ncbi:MAG TPA: histidine phosphatase family protein [Longimicrobium sp.]|jgi:broad specificity phosphatase PhoE
MLRLTLVRHGSTDWNEAGRFQGWGDPPLSALGRGEAERLGAHLAGEEFGRVVASDLLRARETAALALPGALVETDPRLREMSFGAWDGLTWNECVARDGDLIQRWSEDPAAVAPPAGESLAAFEARIAAALAELPEEGSHLWVVHAGVIHAILARWMDVPLRRTFALHISACGITRAELFPGGGARVTCVNETAR